MNFHSSCKINLNIQHYTRIHAITNEIIKKAGTLLYDADDCLEAGDEIARASQSTSEATVSELVETANLPAAIVAGPVFRPFRVIVKGKPAGMESAAVLMTNLSAELTDVAVNLVTEDVILSGLVA